MFEQRILSAAELPINERDRKCTDVLCTFLGLAFGITMLIVAGTVWNRENFQQNFPTTLTDSRGQPCLEGQVLQIVEYTKLEDKFCVETCPQDSTKYQGLCLPKSELSADLLLRNPAVANPMQFHTFLSVLFYATLVSLSAGLLWAGLVHLFPRQCAIICHLAATGGLIALGVLLLVLQDSFWDHNTGLKISVSVLCFILSVVSMVMLFMYSNQVKIHGLFLHYSARFLNEKPANLLYLPYFIFLMFGFATLIAWQHCCFASRRANTNNIFNLGCSGFWGILNIIEFVWGAQFLRDSFNFCIAGNAVDFYWKKPKAGCFESFSRLITSHLGSVIGGSLLNACFQVPTLLGQLLTCHPTACCPTMGATCHNNLPSGYCLLDLIRTDAYSYINMAGIPFCNSARQCQLLCQNSRQFVGTHSPMKHYRFLAHVFLVSVSFIAGWFFLRHRLWGASLWHYSLLVVACYVAVAWFVDLHSNAAEGLQTSYLAEHILQPNYAAMEKLDPSYAADLELWERRQQLDGNC